MIDGIDTSAIMPFHCLSFRAHFASFRPLSSSELPRLAHQLACYMFPNLAGGHLAAAEDVQAGQRYRLLGTGSVKDEFVVREVGEA